MLLKRVVVTGVGVLSPVGSGKEEFWHSLITGKSGIGMINRFPAEDFATRIGGEIAGFDAASCLERKEAKRMDRFTQLAVVGAIQAIEDAGLDMEREELDRVGVIFGTGIGGMGTFEEQTKVLLEKGPHRVSPFFIPMMIANMAAGQISIMTGARGPNYTIINACATGTNAAGEAFKLLQRGGADVVITGGSEAAITPLSFAGFCSMKAMSTRNEVPARACRPFDLDRDGFVLSEGAGVLVMETLEHARARGACIYGEVIGYGSSDDAYHITAPAPEGAGAVSAMSMALADAGLHPSGIDYINAHGTSTELNDRSETTAIKKVFGDDAYRIPVSSTKSVTGHLLGAAGAVELVACLMTIRDGVVPPTINYDTPDPDCDLDYVPNKAREMPVGIALSNSFGFGGQNATIIVKKYKE